MRILANENIPRVVVERLRQDGHDVLWARTACAGATDAEILRRARTDARVLLTQDKDFGELARASKLPRRSGVMLLRLRRLRPSPMAKLVSKTLASRADWFGHFSAIEPDRVRMTRLGK